MVDIGDPAEIKTCCAALYESDWATLLLGDCFHPGGLRSTARLAQLIGLDATHTVLDVASGQGASSVYLSQTLGCRVVGIDLGEKNVAMAAACARRAGLADRVTFALGDAEAMPLDDASVHAVICECAFCTFPAKDQAAAEIARVLRPGGRVGLADLTRTGDLPQELDDLFAWLACIAAARPPDEYLSYLSRAGLATQTVEPHDEALQEVVRTIREKLTAAELLVKLGSVSIPAVNFGRARSIAQSAMQAIRDGRLGYALMTASKPASPAT